MNFVQEIVWIIGGRIENVIEAVYYVSVQQLRNLMQDLGNMIDFCEKVLNGDQQIVSELDYLYQCRQVLPLLFQANPIYQ